MAPYHAPNVKKNKYYQKDFVHRPSFLSLDHPYGTIDTLVPDEYGKYGEEWYVFYDNGLIVNDTYSTQKIKDTITVPTKQLKKQKCHGWNTGCYIIKDDTLYWGTKAGYMKEWTYHVAILKEDGLEIIRTERGKTMDSTTNKISLQTWRVIQHYSLYK
jgi:hypothetical protein